MKIVSWNVNSLRVRLPQVIDWLQKEQPDLLALQETKMADEEFPVDEINAAGYHAIYSGQKTYNGVAIISKQKGKDTQTEIPGLDDPQRRFITATYGALQLINLYVPNGQMVGSDKFDYKLNWLGQLNSYLKQQLKKHAKFIVVGDYNIAPDDRDVHDPQLWEGQVMCSEPERAALQELLDLGFVDTFRLFEQEPNIFSWWDYRGAAFRRNRGLRIDLILASTPLQKQCTTCYIDIEPRKLERPSDHAPVVLELKN
jgi:exodeoxyribonuclease-3